MEESVQAGQGYVRDPPAVAKKIHVPTYAEILEKIKSRYPRGGRKPVDRELARLQATYDIMMSKTGFIRDLVKLVDGLHPFYWRLVEIDFDRKKIHESIKCVSRARKLASKFYEKYRILILASESRRELQKVSTEARGRILSTLRKCRKGLEYLRNLVVFIQHLPSIDASLPTIIVAGAPSTGKSTLVRNVSRAQTKVAAYPFTTTHIHIGHLPIELEDGSTVKVQVIDTPGLLDRPPQQMNSVERRAVAALRELEGVILFLIDVSPDRYMDVDRQIKLLTMIMNEHAAGKKIVIGINKIDQAEEGALQEARRIAKKMKESGAIASVYELSAVDPLVARQTAERIARELLLERV
ncbi:MAG: 50S ribosome-binding GTPase [Desulfurococcales archaeon]|nr:50S ribosome-binding GTPase [Desulfurococcales archaeon]